MRNRLAYGGALFVVIVLGLLSRVLADGLPGFVADHAGDALWTVAVYLTLAIAFPGCPALKLGAAAFAISLAVECSQLVRADWLDGVRRTLPGRLLLGSGFLWVDLLRYAAGAVLAVVADPFGKRGRAG